MNEAEHKKKERRKFMNLRDQLSLDLKKEYDQSLNVQLIDILKTNPIKSLHVYLPMRSEPNISPFIEHVLRSKVTVVCPKSMPGGIMENYVLFSLKRVEKGIFGTSYPSGSVLYDKDFDLIIVPGLAFSRQMDRLGYGGGFYDRFLSKHPNSQKIALAYPFQMVESLECEKHDIKMDEVLLP